MYTPEMKRNKRYSAAYYIEQFSKIPSNKWLVGDFTRKHEPDLCCALGHMGMRWTTKAPLKARSLMAMFKKYLGLEVTTVNDSTAFFEQKTPKGRILAALSKIKRLGG